MFKDNLELLKIYENLVERPIDVLSEGLECSYNPDTVIEQLYRWYETILHIRKIFRKDDSKKIEILISNPLTKEKLQMFYRFLSQMGYYIASYKTKFPSKEDYKWNEETFLNLDYTKLPIMIYIEAKYDCRATIESPKLYHVCRQVNLEKILKIGLVPKSKEKISNHPERIYLSKYLKDAELIKKMFEDRYPNEIFCMLEISLKDIKNEKMGFMEDPNFPKKGIYTYSNIPPNAIKEIK
jgi:hypothetical protein